MIHSGECQKISAWPAVRRNATCTWLDGWQCQAGFTRVGSTKLAIRRINNRCVGLESFDNNQRNL